jgi:hypothetical protein
MSTPFILFARPSCILSPHLYHVSPTVIGIIELSDDHVPKSSNDFVLEQVRQKPSITFDRLYNRSTITRPVAAAVAGDVNTAKPAIVITKVLGVIAPSEE